MLPRIGITGSVAPAPIGTRRTYLNEPYVIAVQAAGGLPLIVTPAHADSSLRALYELLDGLVLGGGEDVAPDRYGEPVRHPSVVAVPERDAVELQLTEWALADRLPLFGICRGLQVLNVALGGTLYQDLPSERPGHLGHDQMQAQPPGLRTEPHHRVIVTGGSALAALTGSTELEVNSLHHQGIRMLAPGLCPVAHAPDGLVEAVEGDGHPASQFLLAVQWHPEELARGGDPVSRRLFESLVAAAQAASGSGTGRRSGRTTR